MGDPFERVPLGRTALQVTPFGLGSAALGYMYEPVRRQGALDTLRRAHELGCGFFDTSPLYGSGLAEARFGAVLPALPRASFTLSDKVGYAIYAGSPLPDEGAPQPSPSPGKDYSYDGTLRMVEGSLKRLGLDHIDILLIHDPDEQIDEALAGTYRALRRMRDEGVVGAIGAGMN
ncbi:MAG: aldo/keto reductase, partial [Chloroflexales bacterium]|nr:aldo/keto reductase [Chloroflexales bacterium]